VDPSDAPRLDQQSRPTSRPSWANFDSARLVLSTDHGTPRGAEDTYAKQRRYAEALSSYERSLRLAEKLGEEQGQPFVLSNIGDLHRAQGRDADARSFYERAFEIADRLGTPERETYRRLRDEMRPQSR